tara:strand:- start:1234 stop:1521 length:288 start_codon:yes stop_codon:yes gene_type:complete
MPRTLGSKNTNNYHYVVEKFDEEGDYIEKIFFINQKQIGERYGISRSNIYLNMNNKHVSKNLRNCIIKKLCPPQPVFEKKLKDYSDMETELMISV